jgi:hypothetical protein
MKKNFFFVLITALLLAPWPVVYAYDSANADSQTPLIQPADLVNGPRLQTLGDDTGVVIPDDIFLVDTVNIKNDTKFQLFISNTNELIRNYRFMNIKIGIFVQGEDAAHWTRMTAANSYELPNLYISIHGGTVDFTLPGGSRYKVVIDTGRFCYFSASCRSEAVSPIFRLSTG